jgi:hypothetical protein
MRILFMRLQVLSQVIDTAAEERNLDLGRTGVRLMPAIGADKACFLLLIHALFLLSA